MAVLAHLRFLEEDLGVVLEAFLEVANLRVAIAITRRY